MTVNSEIYKHTIVICTNLLVKRGDRFLVIKRSPHKLICPNIVHTIGGKVEASEDPYLASQRELLEEAGIVAHNIRLRGVVTEVKPDTIPNWQVFYFLGDYKEGVVRQTEEGDLLWLRVGEIKQSDLYPSFGRIVGALVNETQGPVFARFLYNEKDQLVDGNFHVLKRQRGF